MTIELHRLSTRFRTFRSPVVGNKPRRLSALSFVTFPTVAGSGHFEA